MHFVNLTRPCYAYGKMIGTVFTAAKNATLVL